MRNNLSVLVPQPIMGTSIFIPIRVGVRDNMKFVEIQEVPEGKFGMIRVLFRGING